MGAFHFVNSLERSTLWSRSSRCLLSDLQIRLSRTERLLVLNSTSQLLLVVLQKRLSHISH